MNLLYKSDLNQCTVEPHVLKKSNQQKSYLNTSYFSSDKNHNFSSVKKDPIKSAHKFQNMIKITESVSFALYTNIDLFIQYGCKAEVILFGNVIIQRKTNLRLHFEVI